MEMNKTKKLPELLSPAGSLDAFRAAIDGGADAIYVGGSAFNARINAKNFSPDELCESVKLAHAYGIKVYQTINTMIYDREIDELLRAAEQSANMGVDAFIVSDIGGASLIHSRLPEMELHASTQMSVHNAAGARFLEQHGFSRVVPARELSDSDIKYLVANNPLEVEIFIHGALCVSHSGQCLFSSLVGGRSGNRGLCAQPCRLPYACGGERAGDKYPLSLKDLSLASHVKEIIDSGVASLKIEGRMKSPEYVRGVTHVWRRLLDEGRDARHDDMRELAELFSRGGFTDSYYTKTVGCGMLGVRSESDKQASREVEKFNKITRKTPIDVNVALCAGNPSKLTLSHGKHSVTVIGDEVQRAINAPLDETSVKRSISKLGDTPFELGTFSADIEDGVMMPVSALNALRRSGVEALLNVLNAQKETVVGNAEHQECKKISTKANVARFYCEEQITEKARQYFDVIALPLSRFIEKAHGANGFVMPPVIFDSGWQRVREMLKKAADHAPEYVVITNLGQIDEIKQMLPDAKLIADFRFNIGNGQTAAFFEQNGFDSFVVSPELTLAQIRDIGGSKAAIVYGRVPLMTLEKCAVKALYGEDRGCRVCRNNGAEMTDRRGFVFPILREWEHRNVVYNSLPTSMSDKLDDLARAGIVNRHFIFTTESADEVDDVIDAYKTGKALDGKVRRI